MNLILPIYSFMLLTLLLIVYFSKKRIKTDETKLYSILLILSLFNIVFNIIGIYLGYNDGDLSFLNVLNHFDLPLYFWWASILFVYLLYVYLSGNKKYYHIKYLVFGINTLITLISFALPVEVIITESAGFAIGLCVNMVYSVCGIYLLSSVIIAFLLIKEKNLRKATPIFSLLILGIIAALIQKNIPSLIIIPAVIVLVELIMYFTIENPDVKMVDELIKNRKIIERTSEEKSIFLFKMSQELKQPISNISKEIQTYKNNKLNKSDTDVVIDNIDGNNRKINYLITDVLGINANDNMNIKLLENTYNIYSLINEIEVRTKKLVKSEIDFNFACASNIPKELYGDSLKLKQVLMSVIINSIENTSSGYIHVDVNSITKFDLCRLVISIKDSGSGIDLLTINEILDQDIEISDKEYLKLDELDVDLKIAYKIIKLLNGTMYIKSEVSKGTEVIITLNQYIKEDDEIKNNALIESYIQTRTNAKKILVINDDIKELKKIRKKLEELGYEIYTSLFGKEAINRIKNNEKYDLILIDDDMKLMSGISLLKELSKLGNNSRKIILLEKDKVSIGHHYIEDGFDAYIDKSKLSDEIDKKINIFL